MQHLQHIMHYYFKKGKNASEMQKKICAAYEEGAVPDWKCQKWFVKFCVRDFALDNASWSHRPVEIDTVQMKTLIKNNQRYTTPEIAHVKYPKQ